MKTRQKLIANSNMNNNSHNNFDNNEDDNDDISSPPQNIPKKKKSLSDNFNNFWR